MHSKDIGREDCSRPKQSIAMESSNEAICKLEEGLLMERSIEVNQHITIVLVGYRTRVLVDSLWDSVLGFC